MNNHNQQRPSPPSLYKTHYNNHGRRTSNYSQPVRPTSRPSFFHSSDEDEKDELDADRSRPSQNRGKDTGDGHDPHRPRPSREQVQSNDQHYRDDSNRGSYASRRRSNQDYEQRHYTPRNRPQANRPQQFHSNQSNLNSARSSSQSNLNHNNDLPDPRHVPPTQDRHAPMDVCKVEDEQEKKELEIITISSDSDSESSSRPESSGSNTPTSQPITFLENPATRLNTLTNEITRVHVSIALLQQQLSRLESEKVQILNLVASNFDTPNINPGQSTPALQNVLTTANVSSLSQSGSVGQPIPNLQHQALVSMSNISASINTGSTRRSSFQSSIVNHDCVPVNVPNTNRINIVQNTIGVTKSAIIQDFTHRKPRALLFHPDPESNLIIASHMDGGVRLMDTTLQSLVLRINLNPHSDPQYNIRANVMKFVSPTHLLIGHDPNTLSSSNDRHVLSHPMGLVTILRKTSPKSASTQISAHVHQFSGPLYKEVSAVTGFPTQSLTTQFPMVTAGRAVDQDQGWRLHLWSMNPPAGHSVYPNSLVVNEHYHVHNIPTQHTSRINSIQLMDPRSLVTSGFDGRICTYDLVTSQLSQSFQLKGKKVNHILNSPMDPNQLFVSIADVNAQFGILDRRRHDQLQCRFGFDSKGTKLSQYLIPAIDPYACHHFVVGSTVPDTIGSVLDFDLRYLRHLPMSDPSHCPTSSIPHFQLGHERSRIEVCEFSPHLRLLATAGLDHRIGLHSLIL